MSRANALRIRAGRRPADVAAVSSCRCAGTWCSAILVLVMTSAVARADKHEAQWSVRPLAGMADLQEDGSPSQRAMAGGLTLGLAYGLSNRLDLGAELVALSTSSSRLMTTVVVDGGAPYHGPMTRRSDAALLLLGPTWRWGAAWVPVLTVAAGGGARHRSHGTLTDFGLPLDGKRATTVLDLAAVARLGIERRVHRRLVLGAYVSGFASWGPSAPLLPVVGVSLGMSYVHYPLW